MRFKEKPVQIECKERGEAKSSSGQQLEEKLTVLLHGQLLGRNQKEQQHYTETGNIRACKTSRKLFGSIVRST